MPNTRPLVDRRSRLLAKRDAVSGKACVDWGLWSTITAQTPDPAALLRESHGAKFYLARSTDTGTPPTDEELTAYFEHVRAADRLAVIHAETVATQDPPRDLAHHDAARPPQGEVEAIERARRRMADPGRVHVAHASTEEAVEAGQAAGFSVAATPHHLLLAHDESDLAARGRVNPPLRDFRRRTALWEAFASGRVTLIETDHAPHTLDEKSLPVPEAPSGVPGIETAYPLLIHQARVRGVPPGRVIEAYAEAPAVRLGLLKGRIAPGYDADMAHFDPRQPVRIRGDRLQSRAGWSPFEGWWAFRFDVHYLRGELVVEDGHFIGRPGRGRPLPIVPATPSVDAWRAWSAGHGAPPTLRSETGKA